MIIKAWQCFSSKSKPSQFIYSEKARRPRNRGFETQYFSICFLLSSVFNCVYSCLIACVSVSSFFLDSTVKLIFMLAWFCSINTAVHLNHFTWRLFFLSMLKVTALLNACMCKHFLVHNNSVAQRCVALRLWHRCSRVRITQVWEAKHCLCLVTSAQITKQSCVSKCLWCFVVHLNVSVPVYGRKETERFGSGCCTSIVNIVCGGSWVGEWQGSVSSFTFDA